MSVQTPAPDVAGYADSVRHALADLGPDQVDDLTDGLEADLAEAMADDRHAGYGRTLLEQFGPPEQYAAELRSAAGLEPSQPGSRSGRPHPVRRARALGTAAIARLDATRWWPPVAELLVSLRPVWWLARGWVLYGVLAGLMHSFALRPHSFGWWVVLLTLVVLSVQWGRGRLQLPGRWKGLGTLASVLAVVALLPVLDAAQRPTISFAGSTAAAEQLPLDVVRVDGMDVSNLFVYDAAGNPVPGAQVYDDRGRAVRTTQDDGSMQYWYQASSEPWYLVGAQEVGGATRWNVYPLRGAPASSFDGGTGMAPRPGTTLTSPPWPFAKAPVIAPSSAAVGPAGSATPEPRPSGSSSPNAAPAPVSTGPAPTPSGTDAAPAPTATGTAPTSTP